MWINRATKDRIFTFVLLTVFGVLSIATVVSARSAQVAAHKSQVIIERSNRNSPILDIIKDCTTPGGTCYDRNAGATSQAISVITAQEACVVKESLGYNNIPDRTPAEINEIKGICHKLLGGDALDLLRRVNASLPTTTTTVTIK